MDGLLALGLIFGVPMLATLFIVREGELYKERERNRRD